VPGALGQPRLPGGNVAGHALQLAQPNVAERALGDSQAFAQRGDGARPDVGGVAL
jgi:hypothetical protein